VKNISNVTLINGLECVSIDNNEKYSSLLLSNKKKIKSSLVVAADSRFSKMRSNMGISAFIHNFNKNMIVCRMEHEKPHCNISYELNNNLLS
jgi:2-polyprenyl-6-methoxyphenol hydroxylase-like FAD-dependent oxidoreductase